MALDLSAPVPPPVKAGATTTNATGAKRRGRPPGSTNKPKAPAAPAAPTLTRIERRTQGVEGLFSVAAGILMLTSNEADAAACVIHGTNVSEEVAKVAEDNEDIGNLIDKLSAMGPYAGLIMAVLPLGLQILVNHKPEIPAQVFQQVGINVQSREALTEKFRADMVAKAAREMQERQRVQDEMQRNITILQQGAA